MNYEKMISDSLSKFEAEDKSELRHGLSMLHECLNDLTDSSMVCLTSAINYIEAVIKYSGFAVGFPNERINHNVLTVSMTLLIDFVRKEEGNVDHLRKAIKQSRYHDYEKQIINNVTRNDE
ncbi:TPA: hypothetical protein R2K44_002428 [Raoultella ornithinolytica]|nr:hypothetical protein [Raoultella ornithinolytica]